MEHQLVLRMVIYEHNNDDISEPSKDIDDMVK
jgi:hypothetical protein